MSLIEYCLLLYGNNLFAYSDFRTETNVPCTGEDRRSDRTVTREEGPRPYPSRLESGLVS